MRNLYKFLPLFIGVSMALELSSCSKDDDEPKNDKEVTVTVGFRNVSADLIGGPTSYGANLYYGDPAQITKGYIAQVYGDTYIQFPINYAEQTWTEGQPWQYTYYNGGMAVSNWHDMTGNTYENQLSVYNSTSPSGGNFVVAFGSSDITDPKNAKLSDYAECGKIYFTDMQGYGVTSLGQKSPVSGVDKEGFFKSVMIANTTYTYLVMKNGNPYASALNDENKGWFKVQFIAFNDNDPDSRPIGYVEAYLANFDWDLADAAGFYAEILSDWMKVDLSSLPEASILAINFVGSDVGEWGLNTPTYCALDNFEITVVKD